MSIVDTKEQHRTIIVDILGLLEQALWTKDNNCYIKFEVIMVDIICKIDKKRKQNTIYSRIWKQQFLHIKITTAIYGYVIFAKLFTTSYMRK